MLTVYFILSEVFFGYRSPTTPLSDTTTEPLRHSVRRRRGRLFFLFSAASFGIGFLLAGLIRQLGEAIASFSFAIAVAAYAAVFESWTITSIRVQEEAHFGRSTLRYYYGTLTALVCSVFFASLLLPFTTIGTLIVPFLYFHSLIALFVWYRIGPGSYSLLVHRSFWLLKVAMAVAIFLALGWESAHRFVKETSLFLQAVTVTVFITTFNIMGFVKNSEFPSLGAEQAISWYNHDKKRILKHIFVFIVVGLGFSFGVNTNNGGAFSKETAMRASNVFQLYAVYAVTILACIILAYIPGRLDALNDPTEPERQ